MWAGLCVYKDALFQIKVPGCRETGTGSCFQIFDIISIAGLRPPQKSFYIRKPLLITDGLCYDLDSLMEFCRGFGCSANYFSCLHATHQIVILNTSFRLFHAFLQFAEAP